MMSRHIPIDTAEVSHQDGRVPVFVLDDDPDMRRSLEKLFQEAGLVVRTFASPGEFLEYIRREMVGCLVLDLKLPGMNGLELYETLVIRGCRLPFVVITGYGDVPRVVEAFRHGAVDFIEKPFRSAQLLSVVQRTLTSTIADMRRRQESSKVAELCQSLTPRERELMDLFVDGLSTKQAASRMGISPKTAHVHRAQVLEKMKVESVSQLVHRVCSASHPE